MEEDIAELEIIITTIKEILKEEIKDTTEDVYTIDGRQFKAIENLLTRYKQLEEENKDLQKSVDQIYDDYQDIGKMYFNLTEKIENEIEELDKKEKEELKGMKGQDRYFVKQMYQTKRNILNVLLEGEN